MVIFIGIFEEADEVKIIILILKLREVFTP